jgi:hypothetical protein
MQIESKSKFLSNKEVEFCLNWYNAIEGGQMWLPSVVDFWDGRTYDIANLLDDTGDRQSYAKFMTILSKIRSFVKESFNIEYDLYADTLQLVKWEEGDGQPPHADNTDLDGNMGIAPWRKYAVVIYLNDTYEGGQTYFVNYDCDVQPKAGKIVAFSCDLDHAHGVGKIKGGTRKTLLSFWSDKDINKKLRIRK